MLSHTQLVSAKGRVAMISGGARGLGEAITRRLLADGYSVSIGIRDPDKARPVFADIGDDNLMVHRFDAVQASSPKLHPGWANRLGLPKNVREGLISGG